MKLRNSVPFLFALDVSYFRGIFPSHAIHPVSLFRIYFQTCTWGIRHYHKILTYDYCWEAEGMFVSNIYVRAFAMHMCCTKLLYETRIDIMACLCPRIPSLPWHSRGLNPWPGALTSLVGSYAPIELSFLSKTIDDGRSTIEYFIWYLKPRSPDLILERSQKAPLCNGSAQQQPCWSYVLAICILVICIGQYHSSWISGWPLVTFI